MVQPWKGALIPTELRNPVVGCQVLGRGAMTLILERTQKAETARSDSSRQCRAPEGTGVCTHYPAVTTDGERSVAIDKLGVTGSSPVPPISPRFPDASPAA